MARSEKERPGDVRDRTDTHYGTDHRWHGWLSTREWTFVLLLIAEYYLFAVAGTVALMKALDPTTLQVCHAPINRRDRDAAD